MRDEVEGQDLASLVARLAVAVTVADGRINPTEVEALQQLDRLGLGPVSESFRAELQSASAQPIHLVGTCAALRPLGPDLARAILSALEAIAMSDGPISDEELEVLETIARLLGVPRFAAESPQAEARSAAPASSIGAEAFAESARPSPQAPPTARREVSSSLERAYQLLNVRPGASRAELDRAYVALVERFDPAKLAPLGVEFVVLAVRRLTEVTAAYEAVRGSAGGF